MKCMKSVFQCVIIFCGSWICKDINRACSLWGAEMRCGDNAAGSTFTSALSAVGAQGPGPVSGGAS